MVEVKTYYDIVFIGHVAIDEVHAFEGPMHKANGGAVQYCAMAASWSNKRIAVVTKMAERDEFLLDQIRKARIAVYPLPSPETTYMSVIHPTDNPDERRIFLRQNAGFFSIEDLPSIEPCFAHLAGMTNEEFTLGFMLKLKERGFTLSVDMQSFVRKVDEQTGEVLLADAPQKRDIASIAAKVKLDVVEAKLLTGTDDLEKAAMKLEKWGASEVLITRSDGVLVRHEGKTYFEKFSNKNIDGRTGRGDSTFGAYLSYRMDHDVRESLRFAAALASIKMESPGPFKGSFEDVLNRIREHHS